MELTGRAAWCLVAVWMWNCLHNTILECWNAHNKYCDIILMSASTIHIYLDTYVHST